MKVNSLFVVAASLAYAANDVEAFFMPAGSLVGGAPSTSHLSQQAISSSSGSSSNVGRAAAHGVGCSCISCSPAAYGSSCGCPSCSSGGISSRSHGFGSVRMQAHPQGCGCGDCSTTTTPTAFHGSSCECSVCASQATHGASCACSTCSACSSRPGRRAASSLTVMSMMGAGRAAAEGQVSDAAAFHGASCECSACVAGVSKAAPRGASCACGACASRSCRRGASSLTVMGASAAAVEGGQVSETGAGAAVAGLRQRLAEEPDYVMFEDTMAAIEDGFDFSPKRFENGVASSDAGANEGSCKVFAFGKISELSPGETLACFGEHYRGVLADPDGDSHGNIRAFMETGWDGVNFPDGLPLSPK